MNQLLETSKNKKIPLGIYYINCKLKRVADTEYRLIAELARQLGIELTFIPDSGHFNASAGYTKFERLLGEVNRVLEI